MQNKSAIKTFSILLGLICIFYLSFTYKVKRVENKAKEYATDAKGSVDFAKEFYYLDSMSSKEVYNFFWIRKYTYKDCKERELNLGLDLKGGMNVVLEISMVDILQALSNFDTSSSFHKSILLAKEQESKSNKDFITLFGEAWEKVAPNEELNAIFMTQSLKDQINSETTNADVIKVLKSEADAAFSTSFNVLRKRIDRFGVTQPNIQKLENTNRILIELPGIKDPQRVMKLLQGTANLEFWATFDNKEIYPSLEKANSIIKDYLALNDTTVTTDTVVEETKTVVAKKNDVAAKDSANDLMKLVDKDTSKSKSTPKDVEKNYPFLYTKLIPSANQKTGELYEGPVVGMALYKDTAAINRYLNLPQVRSVFPKDARFKWGNKPMKKSNNVYELYAVKSSTYDGGRAPLDGKSITGAEKQTSQTKGGYEVDMTMNAEGASTWARMTRDNIGKCIAIVLDDYVYSAPRVQAEIKGGNSQITGDFSVEEADDLANVLKSGKLPAPAKIVQKAVVGPSLGEKSINDGMMSFIIAFIVVLLYIWFYYSKAGLAANVALFANVFLIFGTLASFGAVLTLPGIAGIVLTLGIAVDANVLINERIREELRAGKAMRLAIEDGYKHAMPSIIDSNLTSIISGIALYWFGTGPIQGFASTLLIGIFCSMFTAIFISRLILEGMLKKGNDISIGNRFTSNILVGTNVNFIGIRKYFYVLSSVLILISVISLFVQGLNLGLDFKGGHNYTIKFEEGAKINTVDVQKALTKEFDNNTPEVKTYGNENQIKVATKYLIDDPRPASEIDSILEGKIFAGIKPYMKQGATLGDYKNDYQISSEKVGPTVADDLQRQAVWALVVALLGIFLYIFARFKEWRFGMGGVISLIHDTIIVLGAYSLFYKVMPFSLEIDQAFIAAILTVIGFSINDTVIIFDRIREYRRDHPKWSNFEVFNGAFNSTLSRTINTSLTVIFVLVVIFIFGGEVIRGFIFAMLIGIGVGTYSSIFNAAALVFDFLPKKEKEKSIVK